MTYIPSSDIMKIYNDNNGVMANRALYMKTWTEAMRAGMTAEDSREYALLVVKGLPKNPELVIPEVLPKQCQRVFSNLGKIIEAEIVEEEKPLPTNPPHAPKKIAGVMPRISKRIPFVKPKIVVVGVNNDNGKGSEDKDRVKLIGYSAYPYPTED